MTTSLKMRARPLDVEAVRVAGDDTGDLGREIAQWVEGRVGGSFRSPLIHLPAGRGTASLGLWIVKHPSGHLEILTPEEFAHTYQPEACASGGCQIGACRSITEPCGGCCTCLGGCLWDGPSDPTAEGDAQR